VLSRYAEVLAAVSDAAVFSSERAPGAAGGGTLIQDLPFGFGPGVLLNMTDDPRHHLVRRLVTPAVTPRAVAAMEDDQRARASGILDAIAERGRCDFLEEVAVELPIQATLQLMGEPDEDRHRLVAWTNVTLSHDHRELGEENEATAEAQSEKYRYATGLIAAKRRDPGDDILSAVVQAAIEDPDGGAAPLSELDCTTSTSSRPTERTSDGRT
jgi:cytochrome P450